MAVTDRRAQMLLIGAITLAVLFVSLSVVLNGSIHTTTSASEASEQVSASETVALQNSVQRDVLVLVSRAIDRHPDAFTSQKAYVEAKVSDPSRTDLEDHYAAYYANDDQIVSFAGITVTEGRYVEQTTVGEFDDPASNANEWQVRSNTELRRFNVDVDDWGDNNGDFLIEITDADGDIWKIHLNEDDEMVEVDGSSSGTCDTGVAEPRIEVTNATLAGEPCPALEFFEDVDPPYDVTFDNANQIGGTYSFVSKGDSAPGEEVIYGVHVDLVHRTPQIDYEGTVEVAPGEPT